MRKIGLLVCLLIIIAASVVGLFWFYRSTFPASKDTSKKDFLIRKGTGASTIGENLRDQGLIKNSLAFKIYVRLTGKSGKIQAGEYELSPSLSLFNIVGELTRGPKEIWVTIPEGLRREEISDRFAIALGKQDDFAREFLTFSKGKEGYLFPDTYLLPKTVSASVVANKMLATFDQKVNAKMREDAGKGGYSLEEIITLASLIEREAKTNSERPVIAGILYNRLNLGMALQVDAAVQYAVANSKFKIQNSKLNNWWEPLVKEDLAIKSPYNTYKYPGLPPGPIASPGLASINAAVYPQDSDYLYYLHGTDGQIHYARTLEEHNLNVAKYLSK